MAEKEEVKAPCPECGHDVGTKVVGADTKLKVHKVAGERCEGSDTEVQSADTAPEGLDKGDPFDDLEDAQDDEQPAADSTDPVSPAPSETGTQGVASSSTPVFVHVVDVHYLSPYLGDQAWHHENAKMAAKAAQGSGHVLTGAEAQHTGSQVIGDRVLVRYEINVK